MNLTLLLPQRLCLLMVYQTKKKETRLHPPNIILKTRLIVLTFSFSKAKKLKFLTTIAQVTAATILTFLSFLSRISNWHAHLRLL